MSNLNRDVQVHIGKNEYQIKFPNSGQELDIAILIQQISRERYEGLKLSAFSGFQDQATKIEAMATFNILIPDLKKDLNVKSMHELSREQMNEVIAAYTDEYLPFYEMWNVKLSSPKEQVENDKKTDE